MTYSLIFLLIFPINLAYVRTYITLLDLLRNK